MSKKKGYLILISLFISCADLGGRGGKYKFLKFPEELNLPDPRPGKNFWTRTCILSVMKNRIHTNLK